MRVRGTVLAAGALAAMVAGGGMAAYRTVGTRDAAAAAPVAAPAATVPLAAASSAGPLQAQAAAIVGGSASEWTAMAWSIDRKETLFAVNGAQALVPASNNKVFTAVWAMEVLGPGYRFPTDLLATGPIENGALRGDLVIRGSGDPAFGYAEYDDDPLHSPRIMARALKGRGVRVVEGGVVGDATIHDGMNYGPDWPKDTGNGAAAYAPTVSGLPYQRNMVWVRADTADPRGFATEPDVPEIPVVWASRAGRGYAVRKPDSDTITVKGAPGPRGSRYGVGAAEPALLAPAALRQALREEGIEVRGGVSLRATPAGAKLLHRHYSITLAEMVPQLNRHSDNFFAEHLFKAAVAKATGQGSYARGGPASATFFHDRAGVEWGQLWQADGSGLSSRNRTSAHALVSALYYAHQQPWSRAFHESLAVGGERDGTLARMFGSAPAKGNLHAKTGYIRGVRSLSGYVRTAGGELVAFSLIYNGRNTSGARGVQQQLGDLLASYSR
ncbi:MAG TPA: D-alanyl-D-alanine carboxypeptidase/D-alanyl-D-alanine-endopeptidase [Longimicrobiaceae bacterium]|nr:D-alanyl-D-alanine carboxypeptidase/D-alanyl-D-alanine-endopeptidase [Longimicrobiaceae bacterium]